MVTALVAAISAVAGAGAAWIVLRNRSTRASIVAPVVARFYERIGDHAVNIGERVRFLVTGWMPEHDGAARFATRAAASDLE